MRTMPASTKTLHVFLVDLGQLRLHMGFLRGLGDVYRRCPNRTRQWPHALAPRSLAKQTDRVCAHVFEFANESQRAMLMFQLLLSFFQSLLLNTIPPKSILHSLRDAPLFGVLPNPPGTTPSAIVPMAVPADGKRQGHDASSDQALRPGKPRSRAAVKNSIAAATSPASTAATTENQDPGKSARVSCRLSATPPSPAPR